MWILNHLHRSVWSSTGLIHGKNVKMKGTLNELVGGFCFLILQLGMFLEAGTSSSVQAPGPWNYLLFWSHPSTYWQHSVLVDHCQYPVMKRCFNVRAAATTIVHFLGQTWNPMPSPNTCTNTPKFGKPNVAFAFVLMQQPLHGVWWSRDQQNHLTNTWSMDMVCASW